jgi:Lon protease-like protein
MERRRIIQLLTAGAAGFWTSHRVHPAFFSAPQDPLLPLFPLDLVLFPHTILPLHIFEERYKEMIKDCLENQWAFGMLAMQGDTVKNIGCTASISQVVERFPDGRLNILVRGERRFEITNLNQDRSYLRGTPEFQDDEMKEQASEDVRMRAVKLRDRLLELANISTASLQDEPKPTDSQLSYRIMAIVPADLEWKQSLLELRSEPERLDQVVSYLEKLIEYLEKSSDKPAGTPGIALL